jgi:hypothetical protein
MQSDTFTDTFIPDTDSDDELSDYESDSSGDLPKNNNIGVMYQSKTHSNERFMDQSLVSQYSEFNSKYFNQETHKKVLLVDSHNYSHTDINTSNYTISFDHSDTTGNNTVATNFDIYDNVIGFNLISASVRVPQYNINSTNNIVRYKDASNNEHSMTIRKGYYTVTELIAAIQVTSTTESHSVTYSAGAPTFTSDSAYYAANTTVTAGYSGLIFKLVASASITFLWDKDNVTRGAARLLGFFAKEGSSGTDHYSEKPPDFSHHYVDLVIPEIPSIACKKNSFGRDIIDRLQLRSSPGEYLHHVIPIHNFQNLNYFIPMKLSKLTIQLYSENGELFDSNNTDNSFEFELTLLRKDI